jgi:hypothetical protein
MVIWSGLVSFPFKLKRIFRSVAIAGRFNRVGRKVCLLSRFSLVVNWPEFSLRLILGIPENNISDVADEITRLTSGFRNVNFTNEIVLPKHLIHQCPYPMDILITDLDED